MLWLGYLLCVGGRSLCMTVTSHWILLVCMCSLQTDHTPWVYPFRHPVLNADRGICCLANRVLHTRKHGGKTCWFKQWFDNSQCFLCWSIAFFKQKSHIEIPDKIDGILLKTFSLRWWNLGFCNLTHLCRRHLWGVKFKEMSHCFWCVHKAWYWV